MCQCRKVARCWGKNPWFTPMWQYCPVDQNVSYRILERRFSPFSRHLPLPAPIACHRLNLQRHGPAVEYSRIERGLRPPLYDILTQFPALVTPYRVFQSCRICSSLPSLPFPALAFRGHSGDLSEALALPILRKSRVTGGTGAFAPRILHPGFRTRDRPKHTLRYKAILIAVYSRDCIAS